MSVKNPDFPENKLRAEILENSAVYSDATDCFIVSLFEQGLVRNPANDFCLVVLSTEDIGTKEVYTVGWTYISKIDVIDALELRVFDDLWSFIGYTKEKELAKLDNEYLTGIISTLNDYNGYFLDSVYDNPNDSVEITLEEIERIR